MTPFPDVLLGPCDRDCRRPFAPATPGLHIVGLAAPSAISFLAGDSSWVGGAAAAGHQLNIPIDCYRVGLQDCEVIDFGGKWSAAFGVSSDGAVLVRRDGFVAWQSGRAPADPPSELADILQRVLCRE